MTKKSGVRGAAKRLLNPLSTLRAQTIPDKRKKRSRELARRRITPQDE